MRALCKIIKYPGFFIPRRSLTTNSRTLRLLNPFSSVKDEIQVVVIQNTKCADVWTQKLWETTLQEDGVIGADVEWKPTFYKGQKPSKASILQLSGPGLCLVIQLLQLSSIPPVLQDLLKDPVFTKVGVAIDEDLLKLTKDHGLKCNGYHDVGLAAGRALYKKPFKVVSVANLVKAIWDVNLSKSKKIQMSNWESRELSTRQVEYAALDAIAGREAFLELKRRGHMHGSGLEDLMMEWIRSKRTGDDQRARSLSKESDALAKHYRRCMRGGEMYRAYQQHAEWAPRIRARSGEEMMVATAAVASTAIAEPVISAATDMVLNGEGEALMGSSLSSSSSSSIFQEPHVEEQDSNDTSEEEEVDDHEEDDEKLEGSTEGGDSSSTSNDEPPEEEEQQQQSGGTVTHIHM